MNIYRFKYKGSTYVTCYGNDEAENHIWGCRDLASKGLTPYYWTNPDNGRSIPLYTDSFSIEKCWREYTGNYTSRVITPENIGILAKSIQKQLSAFTYDGEEWRVKTK